MNSRIFISLFVLALAVACSEDGGSSLDVDIDPIGEPDADAGNNNFEEDTDNNDESEPCGDVPHGEVVEEGSPGECGDFADECASKGTASQVDRVCEDGEVVEVEKRVPCERETDGVVLEEGEPGECGGFDDECDETGTRERLVSFCQGEEEVEETREEACERDTEGVVLEEGEFGECGGFDGACDETGQVERVDRVCEDGEEAEVQVAEDCDRDTDGVVLEEGEFGECGGFEDVCDETGTQSRTQTVCEEGEEVEREDAQACERETSGDVVSEGAPGECGGFEDACDETGEALRQDVVCQDGQQTDVTTTVDCERDTEGVVVTLGEPGECGGFDGPCGESGQAERVDVICREGQGVEEPLTVDCTRDTDRLVIDEGEFGDCGGFESACDESGIQTRVQTICEAGEQVEEDDFQDCTRDTDGVVVDPGEFGDCGGFEDECDETGTQSRTQIVCAEGEEVESGASQDCTRETDGLVVAQGEFGDCGGFEGVCGEDGTQSRTNAVCVGGQETDQEESQDCTRDTEGVVVDEGEFGDCGGFEDECDETGSQSRIRVLCEGGQETDQDEAQGCTRDTDGLVLDAGEFGDCGGFENECDETGNQSRTQVVCAEGSAGDVVVSQDCSRDTDGLVIVEDEFGDCEGFEGVCDESGVQRRRNVECQGGEEVGQIETQDCTRDTDGVVVDEGEFGDCGGFVGVCGEDGTQSRVRTLCDGGEESQVTVSQDCSRDTDGVVVSQGEFGDCGGFDGTCDETGTQSRAVVVCINGQENNESETQDCTRDTDGVVVSQGEFGDCGGFDGVCGEEGTQSRAVVVCINGQENDESETQGCTRDTDGVVVDEGEFGACRGFADTCDETGTQFKIRVVCVGGQETDQDEEQDCTRDTDGIVVDPGQFGDCGGFEDECDEGGVQTRTLRICDGGQETEQTDTQDCSRETEGIVVSEGEFGDCEDFEGTCDETGLKRRTNVVCAGGQATAEEETQDCTRDTDGVVISQGLFGDCGGFEGVCGEDGTQSRTNVVCSGGEETDQDETRGCTRSTEGVVILEGEFDDCGGFEGVCGEDGTQSRTNVVCEGGQETDQEESQGCTRDTDGVVVTQGEFGDCGGFDDTCDETGTQSRTNTVCEGGQETDEEETQDCTRDTDGVVISQGEFGDCGGFDGTCDETGTQSRDVVVCINGQENNESETQDCTRDTDGVVVSQGEFGDCGGFDDACDQSGVQSRTNVVCVGGQETGQSEDQDCFRETEGVVVSQGEFGECGGFDDECDETGAQTRTNVVCVGGVQTDQTDSQDCTRDTDGVVVDAGVFGACEGFEGACGETGTQSRDQIVCVEGQAEQQTDTQDCSRETEGVVVSQGEFGDCGGFDDECDETGTQTRTNVVCSGGQETDQDESQDCTRDTDGVVVSQGEPGACGNFDNLCDETGQAPRTDVVCQDGVGVDTVVSEDCTRDTEGVVVDAGVFGDCGNFENECDETGSQTRTQVVCSGGQETNQDDTQDCTRDTDGVVVSQGNFGACGGFDGECDETGTQSRDLIVCDGGLETTETESRDCVRDTEGVVIDAGVFGACGGFNDECDETGTQSRQATVCRGGAPNSETQTQACTRVVEGCGSVCGELDDQFERNQFFDEAGPIGEGDTEAFLCREDFFNTQETDIYRFTVPANSDLDVVVSYDHNIVPFLSIVLYGPGGINDTRDFLFPDFNGDPNEDVLQSSRPARVGPNDGGEWFLEVNGTGEGANLDYQITITIDPDDPPPDNCDELGPDIFEANNTCETGTQLPLDLNNCTPGTAGCVCDNDQSCGSPLSCVSGRCQVGFVCGPALDEDHFLITVDADEELVITVPHFHFNGNIDMEVYEPDFQTLAGLSFNAGPNFEQVTINPTVSGTYCVRLFSQSRFTSNSYGIEFTSQPQPQ